MGRMFSRARCAEGVVEPVAVVGAACRVPGGVDSLDGLWRLLDERRDAIKSIPADRWDADAVNADLPGAVAERARCGGFLEEDVVGFDAAFFALGPQEASWVDPQHRMLVEVAWEACEHAGIPVDTLRGTPTGVFTGIYTVDHLVRGHRAPAQTPAYWSMGSMHGMGVGRLAFLMDLHGPCMAVDTACSSSLVAVHLACQSLRSGECDTALASGISLLLSPEAWVAPAQWDTFSPTGRSRSFSASADGYVRAEGCAALVLKRLAQAVTDGDRIRAVLRGSAVNQDGRSTRLTAPSGAAQQQVFEQALAQAGVKAAEVGMVEAHGTGTPVGDPIEFSAMKAVYGQGRGRCAVGSLKSNIGHSEPASGILGLLKTIVSLQRGRVPATLHFCGWSPQIDASGCRLFAPTSTTPWPVEGVPRRAAVSSYGIGGTNAHMIVEQAPEPRPARPAPAGTGQRPDTGAEYLPTYLLSGSSERSLRLGAQRLAHWLEADGARVALPDVAHTLSLRRSHARSRLAVVARGRGELVERLRAYAAGAAPDEPGLVAGSARGGTGDAVFVYSGQGSQWAGMTRQLLGHDPHFTAAMQELEPLIQREGGFSVHDALRASQVVSGVERVQPVLFACQIALTAVWRARGVEPAAVIGHSMGEAAAAVVAGGLSLEEGVQVICRRARLLARTRGHGAMVSVQLDRERVQEELDRAGADKVAVAVWTSPHSTVVSGDAEQVETLLHTWDAQGVTAAPIAVDVASHSPQMDPVLDDLRRTLEGLHPKTPVVGHYSSVLADPRAQAGFDADYWVANQRQAVRFAPAVSAAAADGHRLFIEISPHPLVARAITSTLTAEGITDATALPTLRRDKDEPLTIATYLAAAHCAGYPVDWARWHSGGHLADVPPTSWDRQHYGVELSALAQPPSASLLLGEHTEDPADEGRHLWHSRLSTQHCPWLADHRLSGQAVLPAAAFGEMALAAAADVFPDSPLPPHVKDLTFHLPLPVSAEDTRTAATADRLDGRRAQWTMAARTARDAWDCYATARLHTTDRPRPEPVDLRQLRDHFDTQLSVPQLYDRWRGAHTIDYGPGFSGLSAVHTADGDTTAALAEVHLPDAARLGTSSFHFPPALLDACMQSLLALWTHTGQMDTGRLLLLGVGALHRYGDTTAGRWCHVRLRTADARSCTGRFRLLDHTGTVLAEADHVRFGFIGNPTATAADDRLYQHQWAPAPLTQPIPTRHSRWLLLTEGGRDPLADALDQALRAAPGTDTEVRALPLDRPADAVADVLRPAGEPLTGLVVLLPAPAPVRGAAVTALARDRLWRLISTVQHLPAPAAGHPWPRLWVVTRQAQAVDPADQPSLDQAGLRGLVRVLSYEHPELAPTVVDIDTTTTGQDIAAELLSATPGSPDEIAWRHRTRHTARLTRAPFTPEERKQIPCRFGTDPLTLHVPATGPAPTAELVHDRPRTPHAGEVLLRAQATSLSPQDLPAFNGRPGPAQLPLRACVGTVVTAEDVHNVRVGDTVAAILPPGPAASHAVTRATWCMPPPAALTCAQTASLLLPYLTAWYAVHHLARLKRGEPILVHDAAQGTGLAALHIAAAHRATVLATAASPEQRTYLRTLNIAHVLDPTSPAFPADVRQATHGRPLAVVTGNLSRTAWRNSADLLAPQGRLVDFAEHASPNGRHPATAPFRPGITISSVDLPSLAAHSPETLAALLAEAGQSLSSSPPPKWPCTPWPLPAASPASKDRHGPMSVSVQWPQTGSAPAFLPSDRTRHVRTDGSYVITGGLGGLGMVLCHWLADHQAGAILLNARTAPGPDTTAAIDALRAAGTHIDIILGDLADPDTAPRLVRAAEATGHPLRGILHAAGVVEDATVARLDHNLLDRVWRPKSLGTWYLHQATTAPTVDWWVAFSSFTSMIGSPGQAAYAASNAWMDEFTTWRRAQGLPATTINWGPWGQVGRGAAMGARGYTMLPPREGLAALEYILNHDRPRVGYIDFDLARWLEAYPETAAVPFFTQLLPTQQQSSGAGDWLEDLRNAKTPQHHERLLQAKILEELAALLQLDTARIDADTSLVSLGVDSLLAIETRNRLQHHLNIELPRTILWSRPTISALKTHILEVLDQPGKTSSTAP
ncbi:SDR family NAD(P)-dependent oxidoreductase [Streptomyces sp. NPDC018019]|uniref:SDR family NAD(P)-dependent oxidoreductase n=1 Tax=Streptomyces sp. NPDC018019 TaxID=3365030 RepID=UPI0037B4A3F7